MGCPCYIPIYMNVCTNSTPYIISSCNHGLLTTCTLLQQTKLSIQIGLSLAVICPKFVGTSYHYTFTHTHTHKQTHLIFSSLVGKPTQVQLLDYVVKKLTTNMALKSYCLHIGLEDSDYEVAMANNPHSIQSAAMDVVMAWYRGKGRPRKWSTVASAFQSIDMGDYASELAEKIRSNSI